MADDNTRISVWDGIPLHVRKWKPSEDIRVILFISHGVGEHMGRYEKLGPDLADNGVLVVGHDHVGHGKSGGERVYIEDFSVYVRDVINHIQDLKATHPGLPFFLMGHSMGGLVAVLVAAQIQNELDGLILSAAGLGIGPLIAGSLEMIGIRIIGRIARRMKLKSLPPSLMTSIPEEVEKYIADPFIYHDGLKGKWCVEFDHSIGIGKVKVADIIKPVLILHGSEDGIVPLSVSEFINDNIGSEDKKFEVFDGDFHDVFNDKNRERAQQLVKSWIISHTSLQAET